MPRVSYTESNVIDAILDVTDNGLSQSQAAQKNGIPPTTLSNRLRGVPSKSEATQPAQLLSKPEESSSRHRRCPSTTTRQGKAYRRTLASQVHETTSVYKDKDRKRQEASTFNCFTPTAVNWYFDIREREYGWIKPENTINVDEGGIMAGFGLDSLVIGSSDPKRKAFLKRPQSRAWTSFVETVTADGRLLKPGIIFKEKELQQQWFIDELREVADWYYITSDNGWTDNHIAVEWLKEVYLPRT
ncbi:hypothetical protein FNYG_15669 [Fusarium nygamai]|uniref:HTH psq-type domain-containing protein n=1 Tax=Gibberella nygamai TaxID=42673 RepID=A0A2K0U7Y1_GIBNY|nr:hypothetical protein FNYG_15669 [Fusarium nygamai]